MGSFPEPLQQIIDRPDVTHIDLDETKTVESKTEGFTDHQIREMDAEALRGELRSIVAQETSIQQLLADASSRRARINAILKRKAELG